MATRDPNGGGDVEHVEKAATVSACGLYRYDLTRVWDPARGRVAFCMLNPSTADGAADDPTIRRCVGFADRWGYGSLVVVNLFAFRATRPHAMLAATDPIGPENDAHIRRHAAGRIVVCGWGAIVLSDSTRAPAVRARRADVLRLIREAGGTPKCLGLTYAKHPRHPLYLPANTDLMDHDPQPQSKE